MNKTPSFDYAIIGCGIAGASLAYELSEAGSSVIVLESESFPAFHTTGRSAAFYMEAYGNECVRKITSASRIFFDSPPNNFCDTKILKPCGALYIGTNNQREELVSRHKKLSELIDGCQLVDRSFIKDKVHQISNSIQCGFWEPGSCEIDVATLMEGYIKLAKRNGVNFCFNSALNHIEKRQDQWRLNKGILAKTIVNAAGAWSDQVANLAGVKPLGLTPKKRNICIAKVDEQFGKIETWPLCIDIDEKYYFKPSGSHLLITPSDEIDCPPHDAQADENQIALGISRVEKAIDIKFTHLQKKWAGLRTFSKDRSPVIGFDTEVDNFFWMAGQGGYGIQMSPALAKLSCSLLTGNTFSIPDLDLHDVSPSRFLD